MAASKHGAAAVLVILFLAIMRAHGNDSHAINCMKKWRKDGIYINCSARNLTVVPDFTHRSFITQLDLSSNNISVLSNTPFKDMKNMTHLDLSRNRLVCLPVDVFKGLQSLKYLSLYANNIPLNNHSYPDGLFYGLKRLKFLDLRRNDPCTDLKNGAYPSTALVDLKSLEELHIDALYHTSFDYLFRKMKSLSKLIMTTPGINCFLGNISVNYFQNLPYLSFVDVSSCGIKSVEKGLFQSLRSLNYLDVSGNQWLTFKSLYNLTYGMHKTNIQVLKMKNIHCTGGIGTYLRTCQMTNLFKTKLRELYLDQNRIEIIEKGLLPQLPQSLKHLSIAQNKLTMGLYMFDFSNLANLEVVNSSLLLVPPNPVNVILQDCKEDLDTPACPKVTTNCQNYMQKEDSNKAAEISQKEKVRTAFEINGSADDNVDDLYGFAVPILLPPKLRVLYYNNSRLYWSVKSALISRNNLEELYVQNNFFYELHGPIYGIKKLKILDLRNNRCTHISKTFFASVSSIKILRAGNNMLGESFKQDTQGEIFQSMYNAEIIDISKNEISVLSQAFLWNTTNIRILDIHNNYISDFKVKIEHMMYLRKLNLSNNKLSSLDGLTMKTISKLFKRNNAIVDISENPIECTCKNVKFLKWMHSYRAHFDQIENYKCSHIKQLNFNFSLFDSSILLMERHCTSYDFIICVCVTCLTVMITLIIARIAYKNRWKIRYFLYMTKLQYSGYVKLEQHNFDYDAFISYAADDRWFVVDGIMPILEKEKGLRFILHDRDFLPGNDISDNIMAAIRNSRKTVCVLSKNFFKSYWCTFEFNMACMENFNARKGEKIIFLILLEDIRDEDLQPKMLEYMEDKSYIKVPTDGDNNAVFWNNIYKALID